MLDFILSATRVIVRVLRRQLMDSLVTVTAELRHGQRVEPARLRYVRAFLVTGVKLCAALLTQLHDLGEAGLHAGLDQLP